jgi:hypothetical protein
MNKIKNNILSSLIFVLILVPFVVYGQYYIIEDIPDLGDDGLMPKAEVIEETGPSQQIIEDTTKEVTEITTETEEVIVETTVTKNKKTLEIASIIGTIAGATLAMASTAIPLFATTPTMMQDLLFLNLFGFLSKKKNERRWGVVFDSDTKRPIPAVKVTLFDEGMKELDTTYTDKEGRFGFLTREGKYKIDVYKKNYKLVKDLGKDPLYGETYGGGSVEITGDSVLGVNIPLKSTTIDWQAYADKKVKEYTSTWSLVKKYLFTSLYIIGFVSTIIITMFFPSIINIILVIINVVLFLFIFFFKRKDHGTVITSNKKPVPFAVVNLYDENGSKDAFAVTDVIGRYYMLADNGRYRVKAMGQSLGAQSQTVQEDVHVRDGLVDKDIVFK